MYKVFIDDDNIIPILTIGNGKEIENDAAVGSERGFGKTLRHKCSNAITTRPPEANCTNTRQSEFVLFFERDYFGVCVGMNIASPEPPTPTAWKTQKRDENGNFTK